ncbi:MAG: RHS repeat-associated core domain-containing protein, partial [Verrucomicrobiota bacterium]
MARYDYIGARRVARRDYGNATRMVYQYDELKRVTGTTHILDPDGIAGVFDNRAYTWDAMHNKTSRRDLMPGGVTNIYSYDSLYRMIRSSRTSTNPIPEVVDYGLDGVGNRTTVSGGTHPGSYTMDPSLPGPADAQLNQYSTTSFDIRRNDDNGNLAFVNRGLPNEKVFVYDYRNRMVLHSNQASATVTSYAYDALGRRIQKVVDDGTPETTRFFHQAWQVVEEQDENGATLATYVYGRYIDEPLTMQRGGTNFFYHGDDLYNVMKVTDAAGDVVESYDYGDYGQPRFFDENGVEILESRIGNPYLFTGRRFDSESGFYYYRTRYLDPEAGRFTTRDTIGIWGDPDNLGNGYTYVGNNP